MASTSELVAYLRDCYEADNRETGIPNLLQDKHRHLTFLSGEDSVLRGLVSHVTFDQTATAAAQKEALLYRRDKTLVFATMIIAGPSPKATRLTKRLCAPLFFFESEFDTSNDVLVLHPRLDDLRINFPVLAAMSDEADQDEVETLQQELPELPWTKQDVLAIAATMSDLFPDIDFTPLAEFPKLSGEKSVRQSAGQSDKCVCLPACAMALIPNSPDTRGVLFELSELASASSYSPALTEVFNPREDVSRSVSRQTPNVPTILSAAQLRTLESARENRLTFVNGPPGTGKSHTIAAIAVDHIARGETALIASRGNQAVDVVSDKIEQLMGSCDSIVRAGRKEHLRQLKKSLERLLGGVKWNADAERTPTSKVDRRLKQLDRNIAANERQLLASLARHASWGELSESITPFPRNLFSNLQKRWLDWRLDKSIDLSEMIQRYQQLLDRRVEVSRELIRRVLDDRIARLLKRRRTDLTKFLQGLRARGDAKQQRLFSEVNFSDLLHAFPVWLCKLSDLANVLPATSGLFDVAIIDEATQCDMASALPLLQRANRVVVVGDPAQLRHVSFLSEQRQRGFGEEHNLSSLEQQRYHFRNKSVLDVVQESITQQQNVVFLNEHFRSLPAIIRFSNEQFYAESLNVMQQRPDTIDCRCVSVRKVSGTRAKNGVNREEADALLHELRKQLTIDGETGERPRSIGILSPFRNQVDHLQSRLSKEFSFTELQQHDVLVGTAHAFQGEERETMLISLCADATSHAATFRFLNNPNVFNVAITRARTEQIVFCSFHADEVASDSLVAQYLRNNMSEKSAVTASVKQRGGRSSLSTFQDEVANAMKEAGLQVWRDFPVASVTIDLVIGKNSKSTLGLDLVGHPSEVANALSLERYRMIERAGMTVIPLSFRDWSLRREECLAGVRKRLT